MNALWTGPLAKSSDRSRSSSPSPLVGIPLVGMPLVGIPLVGMPLVGIPLVGIPFVGIPLVGIPFVGIPLVGIPLVGIAAVSRMNRAIQAHAYNALVANGFMDPLHLNYCLSIETSLASKSFLAMNRARIIGA